MEKGNYQMGTQKLLTALERNICLKGNTSRTHKPSSSMQKGKKQNQMTEIVNAEFDTNEYENNTKENSYMNEKKQVTFNIKIDNKRQLN